VSQCSSLQLVVEPLKIMPTPQAISATQQDAFRYHLLVRQRVVQNNRGASLGHIHRSAPTPAGVTVATVV
jgi:hypothetical protein